DVTARRAHEHALRESEIRFRALSSATADVIYRMSPDWKYMHELDGRGFLKTTTELAEYRIEEYVYPDDLDLARAAIDQAIRTKAVFELEHRVLRADGTCGWTYSKAVPILEANGDIREWVGSASDITKRKIAEQELTEASRRKDEFLAMLAHELRNPLAPVLSAAEMLRLVSHGDERVGKASGVIVRQVRHLSTLVDDLLDVSRVTRGLVQLKLESVEFDRVIDNAVEQSRPLLEARKHAFTLEVGNGPHLIVGDRNRLVQVVVNLLNNAIKYTPEHGHIAVTLQNDGSDVIVTVEDNGVGIDANLLPHIFELFTQAERQPDRSHGGLGIGLALVKTIVEMHGGTIAVRSAGLGNGSLFSASFPVIHRPEES
ncbi:MAG TPA: PAS domain-containing sensor histidine kinase, partial [Telluria sp.]